MQIQMYLLSYTCGYTTRVIMPQKEIERVLDAYTKEKVGAVVIYDETFLSDQPYSWMPTAYSMSSCPLFVNRYSTVRIFH
jgi:hypothetical protein